MEEVEELRLRAAELLAEVGGALRRNVWRRVAPLEPIFRDVGGRPHGGKFHTCGARELAARYPEYERFRALRARLDPKGVFRNAHLRELFPD